MPFYNPFWATISQVHYLTLGMLPISAVATGSQTAVGSSPNTIQVTYATQDNAYWSQPRTIPAYTYFTFGTTELTENNVTPVANLEVANLPSGTSNNQYALNITVASGSASKPYDGTPLILYDTSFQGLIEEDAVYYTGNHSLTITHNLTLSPGTLTVEPASTPPTPPTPPTPLTAGSFTIEYLTNDHSIDTTYINGSWSGGTYPYTVTVNGTRLSESSSAGPGGSDGWKRNARGYGLCYDLYYTGTYVIVITDANNNSITETVEYTGGVENSGGENSN